MSAMMKKVKTLAIFMRYFLRFEMWIEPEWNVRLGWFTGSGRELFREKLFCQNRERYRLGLLNPQSEMFLSVPPATAGGTDKIRENRTDEHGSEKN
jgi:hypothetical protein